MYARVHECRALVDHPGEPRRLTQSILLTLALTPLLTMTLTLALTLTLRRAAAPHPVRVLPCNGQLQRRAGRLLGSLPHAPLDTGRLHLGLGGPGEW